MKRRRSIERVNAGRPNAAATYETRTALELLKIADREAATLPEHLQRRLLRTVVSLAIGLLEENK